MKKHLSLVTREFLFEGVPGSVFILMGIVNLFSPNSLGGIIVALAALVLQIASLVLASRKKHFDVWDETADIHLHTAYSITITIVEIALLIFANIIILFRNQIVINSAHVMIAWGIIKILKFIMFVICEKRAA